MKAKAKGLGIAALIGCATACLAEPPVFEAKESIPPVVSLSQVQPSVVRIYNGGVPFEIVVPFRSEDLNRGLEARVFLNLPPEGGAVAAELQVPVPAGHWDETGRSVSLYWDRELEGCNSLTFAMAYEGSFPTLGLPSVEAQTAYVVWWLNSDDSGVTPVESCGRGVSPP